MPADPLTLRTAGPADATQLAALVTHLGYPTDAEAMRLRLARIAGRDDYVTLVAARGERLTGFAGVMQAWSYTADAPSVRLLALVVEPEERGKGTGAALLEAAEAWARERGAVQIHLTTALHREGAQRFYEGRGYERTGLRYLKKLV